MEIEKGRDRKREREEERDRNIEVRPATLQGIEK